jgi:hypothetical protein
MCNVLFSLPSAPCSPRSAFCPMRYALCALPSALRTTRSALCALRSALCPMLSAPCTTHSALCALRFTLCPEAISFFGQTLHQRIKWLGKCDDTVVLELLGDGAQIDAKRF